MPDLSLLVALAIIAFPAWGVFRFVHWLWTTPDDTDPHQWDEGWLP